MRTVPDVMEARTFGALRLFLRDGSGFFYIIDWVVLAVDGEGGWLLNNFLKE